MSSDREKVITECLSQMKKVECPHQKKNTILVDSLDKLLNCGCLLSGVGYKKCDKLHRVRKGCPMLKQLSPLFEVV